MQHPRQVSHGFPTSQALQLSISAINNPIHQSSQDFYNNNNYEINKKYPIPEHTPQAKTNLYPHKYHGSKSEFAYGNC